MPNSPELKMRFNELLEDVQGKKTHIAKEMGITYANFQNISDNGFIPKPLILARIADYFEVSIEYLIGRTDADYFDKAKTPKTFHERLNELKEDAQISFYELSQALGVTSSYTSDWSTRKMVPYLDNLTALADYFKVSVDYLLGRTDVREIQE